MEDVIAYLLTQLPETWIGILGTVITVASAITMFLASRSDNKLWGPINTVLNMIALNIGKNKNADAEQRGFDD